MQFTINVWFYTADEKLCKYEHFLVRNIKTGTNRFNPGRWEKIPKTGTVLAKSGQLECLQKQITTNMTGTP